MKNYVLILCFILLSGCSCADSWFHTDINMNVNSESGVRLISDSLVDASQLDSSLEASIWVEDRVDIGMDAEIGSPPFCQPNSKKQCDIEVLSGVCSLGEQVCFGGEWTPCYQVEFPRSEECNGLDDDCDGEYDEPPVESQLDVISQACYTGPPGTEKIGLCRTGVSLCRSLTHRDGSGVVSRSGEFGPCERQQLPVEEVCDSLDNDCDGEIDEGVTNECGGCGLVPRERCNFRDDDCDGEIDEGLGVCNCENPLFEPQAEVCDGIDNDCDGQIDRDGLGRPLAVACSSISGESEFYVDPQQIPEFHGVCAPGIATCQRRFADGEFRHGYFECHDEVFPSREHCDNQDNDCDGEVDEDFERIDSAIVMIVFDISGSMSFDERQNGINACTAIALDIESLGFNDRVRFLLVVVGSNRDPALVPPADTPVFGIDPNGDPDLVNALPQLVHGFPEGGATENTLDALWNFAVDDLLDLDNDGRAEDILWMRHPVLDISGEIDIPDNQRIAIIIGDERAQSDNRVHSAESVLDVIRQANMIIHLVSEQENFGSYGYEEGMDNIFLYELGARGNGEGIVEAILLSLEDLICQLGGDNGLGE